MVRLSRPGGVLGVQEPNQASWNFWPPLASWPRLNEIIEAAFGLRGDINIGRRTFQLLRQAGLGDVRVHAAVLALQDAQPYMRLPMIAMGALRAPIVAAGIASEAELDALVADVERHVAQPDTIVVTFTTTQAWGRVVAGTQP